MIEEVEDEQNVQGNILIPQPVFKTSLRRSLVKDIIPLLSRTIVNFDDVPEICGHGL